MTVLAAACMVITMLLNVSIADTQPTEGLVPPIAAEQRTGIASWYDNGPGIYAAAGPALRVGHWRGRTVQVCASRCVTLRLVDYCACPKRVIDLSPAAFRATGTPLSRGLVRVTVTWGDSPQLPPTDTE